MIESIYDYFSQIATQYPDRTALMYKKEGEYMGMTYRELNDSVESVACGIREQGIRKGDTVGIFSYNRPEWVIADLAILKLGGIVVPIYHTLPPSSVKYIINDSKIKLLFVENFELFGIIDKIRKETPSLKNIVLFDPSGKQGDFLKFDSLRKTRYKYTPSISSDDIATIVYTSGTTGEPKGVILTHHNIVSNAISAMKRFKAGPEDVFFSFLPLCHMFERTDGYYTILFAGGSIGYAEDLSTVAEDIAKIRPTLLLAVPRAIEKAYNTAVKRVEEGSPIKKALVFSAIKNLNECANLRYKKLRIPFWLKIKCSIYNVFVSSKFKKVVGGRLRLLVSGGAPLNRQIAKVLYILGFNIVEGYGLTETSPCVCSTTLEENILGAVGKPFDGVEVKIGEDEEILVKGPNVMKGYLNKPEETAKVIDENGWLHTGDKGRFDENGNLIITGRIKEIIVTSYGKNIAPIPIEEKISRGKYIDQVMVYGDKRKCIVALIVPDKEKALLHKDEIKGLIAKEIEKVNRDLASYESVKDFALLQEGFTIENGMLTPTLKLRRGEIAKRYAGLIDAIYKDMEQRDENYRKGKS